MTKNIGNATRNSPAKEVKPRRFDRLAPALFPLAVVAIGYLVGRQFFGF